MVNRLGMNEEENDAELIKKRTEQGEVLFWATNQRHEKRIHDLCNIEDEEGL